MQAPGQVQRGSREGSGEASGEGLGGCGAEPGQVQQGSGKGAKPSQVQQGSGEGSGEVSREGLGCFGAETGQVPAKVPVKVWEASVQSKVSFNRVPEKVLEKACQVRFRLWCKARSGSTGFWEALVQTQLRYFQRLASQRASERFVKIKHCGCWGYH